MDANQFLSEFGHIANSPSGVTRLRQLILVLATQGKLVPQGENENTRSLLEKIHFEKQALVSSRGGRRSLSLPEIKLEDQPNPIPSNWDWVRFGEIAIHNSGKTLDTGRNSGHPRDYITTSNVYWGRFDLTNLKQMLIRDEELEKCTARKGDLLICEGGEAGRAAVWSFDHEVCFQNHVHRARFFGGIEPLYAYHYFEKLNATGEINAHRKGIGISNMSGKALSMIEFPLPPLEEQRRIVARVDDLMSLCNQLEQEQQKRRKLQNALRRSTLRVLASAESPHELEESWKRIDGNFSHISGAPEDVDDFIVELKSLAVRGLLVSSSSLMPDLDRIKDDCTTLQDSYIAKKMMRKQKTVGMAERDTLYPDHWAVAAFDEVAIVIGGVTKGRNLRDRQTITCPYLAVANVQRGFLKLDRLKSIEIATEELEKYVVVEGDLLTTEGGDWDKVGRTAIWRGEIENCLHQNHVFKARVPSDLLFNEWVELVFNSGVGRDYFAGASKQTTNLASINMTQLRSFPMPIPPVDEQKRILETLSSLTELCEDWRSLLEDRQELSASFANAAIASLTGIATDQKEEAPVKAPQTELIAPLRLGTTPDVNAQAPLTTILARHKGELPARDLWQRFGGEIDAFYAQLKTEVAHGWIAEPAVAEMLEKPAEAAGA